MQDLNTLSLPELFSALTADGGLDRLLVAAMDEDVRASQGGGDITTDSIVPADQIGQAHVVPRHNGVIAGVEVIRRLANDGRSSRVEVFAADGDRVDAGTTVATLNGPLRHILKIERTMLNLFGRLCGVATVTRRFVDVVAGTKAVICDTRKTTPGLRNLEKYAVRCGGGTLHRIGLYDAALYKDNHLAGIALPDLAGRMEKAASAVRSEHDVRFVEVEVDRIEQMEALLQLKPGLIDFILLDNMPLDRLREAVGLRDRKAPHIKLEASGGVSLSTVRGIAETGVDRISVGAITHSAPCLDVALDIEG